MNTKTFALSLAILFGSITICHSCSCLQTHPQAHYCRSDFVILARVKKEQVFESTHSKVYKVRVRKAFKMSEKGLVALKSGRLHTPMDDSACGSNLEVGKLYVISGNINSLRAHIYSCNWIEPWDLVSKRQRKGLRLLYKHGCGCDISNLIILFPKEKIKDRCNWRSFCEAKEGICLRQANGSCDWNRTKRLTTCPYSQTFGTINK